MQSRLLTLLGKPYDPLWPLHNLPSLQAWYTFDDPAYLRQVSDGTVAVTADGDPIGYCMDRSGNGRHIIQATAGNRPTWRVGIRNGRAVARFDGDDFLLNSAPGALLRNVAGATMVMVLQTTAPGTVRTLSQICEPALGSRLVHWRELTLAGSVGFGARRLDADALTALESVTGVFTAGAWGVHSTRVDYAGAYARGYFNTAQVMGSAMPTAGNTEDTDAAILAIGASRTGGAAITGEIADVIICGADTGLSLLQQLWYRYVRPKWGGPPFELGSARISLGVVADLHYADRDTLLDRVYRDSDDKLTDAVLDWNNEAGLAFCIELGDYIDHGGLTEAQALTDLAVIDGVYQGLTMPRYYALGNHCLDMLSKAQFCAATGMTDTYYSFDSAGVHFVVLDPCFRSDDDADPFDSGNFSWDVAYVPPVERAWLAADLAATSLPTVVFCHYRLDGGGGAGLSVINHAAVRAVLEASGKVGFVFTGHFHDNFATTINRISYYGITAMVTDSYPATAYGTVSLYDPGTGIRLVGRGSQKSY